MMFPTTLKKYKMLWNNNHEDFGYGNSCHLSTFTTNERTIVGIF